MLRDRYRVEGDLGTGTFGRVVECRDLARGEMVAIKIIRSARRYHESARIEADVLRDILAKRDERGGSLCVRLFEAFDLETGSCVHHCMVFETLGKSLYDVMKDRKYHPFPLGDVLAFATQLLDALDFLHNRMNLVHTDLKPENVLLLRASRTRIKIIDFGGATYDTEKKSSVICTRQYCAPEVILSTGWSFPSDLWSVGCILAELCTGDLLFATHDNVENLALMERIVGKFPNDILSRSCQRGKSSLVDVNDVFDGRGWHRRDQVLNKESENHVRGVRTLKELLFNVGVDDSFFHLLRGLLIIDDARRITARDALKLPVCHSRRPA